MVVRYSTLLACSLYLLLQLAAPFAKTPLSDRILHYEPLSYPTARVHDAHERVRRGEPALGGHRKSPVRLSFAALDRNFSLLLWPNRDVFAPNARFLFHGKDGVQPADYDPATFYRGKIEGDDSSRVHGHLVNGVFDGVLRTGDGEEFHVEAARKYFRERRDNVHSVIYSVRDVVFKHGDQEASCALKDELLKKLQKVASTARPDSSSRPARSIRRDSSTLSNLFSGTQSRSHSRVVPRTNTVSGGLFCQVRVAADHLFLQHVGGGSESATISEIASVFAGVQSIFQSTDFDQDGVPDSITPQLVQTDILDSSAPGYLFSSSNIPVDDFLDRWSTIDHGTFCLALLLTYRDFANGVLGLAWVGSPPGGTRGGICDSNVTLSVGQRSLNTAIVSFLNYGSLQPRAVTMVTIAHEIGHNFGSPHDPDTSGTCSPGSPSGNYIMYPRATDGNLENNILFSPCSISSIYGVVTTKSSCFQIQNSFCGNLIVETGEECDCGSSEEQCRNVDSCCMANMCMLKPSADCSLTQGCCTPECTIVDAGVMCFNGTECANSSFCLGGNDPECPEPAHIDASCMEGLRYCQNGECTGSICLTVGFTECQCTGDDGQLCHVCCRTGNEADSACVSTFTLAERNMIAAGQFRDQGRSCNNYQGYCNDEDPPKCVTVDNEQTLDDLLDIFTIDTLNTVLEWFKNYWWIVVIVIVVIVIVIVLLHLTYRRKKIKKHRRRMSTMRGSASGQSGRAGDAGPGGRTQQRKESAQLLKRFFPNCDAEMIEQVLRSARSEPKAVKQLLSLGYPLKKIPMPRLA